MSDPHATPPQPKQPKRVKRGLVCPACGGTRFRTRKTRGRAGGYVYRLRECRECGQRAATSERVVGLA